MQKTLEMAKTPSSLGHLNLASARFPGISLLHRQQNVEFRLLGVRIEAVVVEFEMRGGAELDFALGEPDGVDVLPRLAEAIEFAFVREAGVAAGGDRSLQHVLRGRVKRRDLRAAAM